MISYSEYRKDVRLEDVGVKGDYCEVVGFKDKEVVFYVSNKSLLETIEGRITKSVKNLWTKDADKGFYIGFSTEKVNPVTLFRDNTEDLCQYWNGFKNIDNEHAVYVTMEEATRDKTVTEFGNSTTKDLGIEGSPNSKKKKDLGIEGSPKE